MSQPPSPIRHQDGNNSHHFTRNIPASLQVGAAPRYRPQRSVSAENATTGQPTRLTPGRYHTDTQIAHYQRLGFVPTHTGAAALDSTHNPSSSKSSIPPASPSDFMTPGKKKDVWRFPQQTPPQFGSPPGPRSRPGTADSTSEGASEGCLTASGSTFHVFGSTPYPSSPKPSPSTPRFGAPRLPTSTPRLAPHGSSDFTPSKIRNKPSVSSAGFIHDGQSSSPSGLAVKFDVKRLLSKPAAAAPVVMATSVPTLSIPPPSPPLAETSSRTSPRGRGSMSVSSLGGAGMSENSSAAVSPSSLLPPLQSSGSLPAESGFSRSSTSKRQAAEGEALLQGSVPARPDVVGIDTSTSSSPNRGVLSTPPSFLNEPSPSSSSASSSRRPSSRDRSRAPPLPLTPASAIALAYKEKLSRSQGQDESSPTMTPARLSPGDGKGKLGASLVVNEGTPLQPKSPKPGGGGHFRSLSRKVSLKFRRPKGDAAKTPEATSRVVSRESSSPIDVPSARDSINENRRSVAKSATLQPPARPLPPVPRQSRHLSMDEVPMLQSKQDTSGSTSLRSGSISPLRWHRPRNESDSGSLSTAGAAGADDLDTEDDAGGYLYGEFGEKIGGKRAGTKLLKSKASRKGLKASMDAGEDLGSSKSLWKLMRKFSSATLKDKHRPDADEPPPMPILAGSVPRGRTDSSASHSRRSSVATDYGVERDPSPGFMVSKSPKSTASSKSRPCASPPPEQKSLYYRPFSPRDLGALDYSRPPPLPRPGNPTATASSSSFRSASPKTVGSDMTSSKFFTRGHSSHTSTSSHPDMSDSLTSVTRVESPPPLPFPISKPRNHIVPPDELTSQIESSLAEKNSLDTSLPVPRRSRARTPRAVAEPVLQDPEFGAPPASPTRRPSDTLTSAPVRKSLPVPPRKWLSGLRSRSRSRGKSRPSSPVREPLCLNDDGVPPPLPSMDFLRSESLEQVSRDSSLGVDSEPLTARAKSFDGIRKGRSRRATTTSRSTKATAVGTPPGGQSIELSVDVYTDKFDEPASPMIFSSSHTPSLRSFTLSLKNTTHPKFSLSTTASTHSSSSSVTHVGARPRSNSLGSPALKSTVFAFRELKAASKREARTEDEKNKMWADLMERSERAGGTLHAIAQGELMSDSMILD
ncbi:hypothetical protein BOTBODRAFT_176846 [Botryobasidium botryosum FD-172 SS1]|uniref:Uncharacterized protein n=1 Tax=Botryobasidium botryosum (strain FD-172 SS1) TaxID=930990 RepID=A0A067MJ23_BOTB1|nr:hypothetical protein BOTBODRAFT_176846 [Botryobasidium botryosum FD-172 SS1]